MDGQIDFKQVTISIELGNDDMKTKFDLANALIDLAKRIKAEGIWEYKISDINGNSVGKMMVIE